MKKTEVIARLYEMAPGIYHVSIVVFGWEYSYGQDGFARTEPHHHHEKCKEEELGMTEKTERELDAHLSAVRSSWTSKKYNAAANNCQHFAEMLTKYLEVLDLPEDVKALPEMLRRIVSGKAFGSSFKSGSSFSSSFSLR